MKIKIIVLLVLFLGCRKINPVNQERQQSKVVAEIATTSGWVGDPSRSPDLNVMQDEVGHSGTFHFGVRTTFGGSFPNIYTDALGNTYVQYLCPIANYGSPSANNYSPLLPYLGDTHYSGADFIYQNVYDSTATGDNTGIKNPQFLSITVFQNGLPVSSPADNYKHNWSGADEFKLASYNSSLDDSAHLNYYSSDTGVLHPMFADFYFETAKLNGADLFGKFVVKVTVNEESYIVPHNRLFYENNYSNNTATMPFKGNGIGIGEMDTTAMAENRPVSVSNLTATAIKNGNGKGKIRAIRLDWVCPYHATGVIHKFKIVRSDGVVYDNLWDEGLTDTSLPNRINSLSYSVYIKIEGLGISNPAIVKL